MHPLRTLASVLLALGALLTLPAPAVAAAGRVDVIEVTGLIDPVEVDFIAASLRDAERGLDDRQYIVPGGGGFGELMNNAYV